MNTKSNKKILNEAMLRGCKTVSDLAHFIKMRSSLPTVLLSP